MGIKEALGRIIRIEPESPESAQAWHARRMADLKRREIDDALRGSTIDPSGLSFFIDEGLLSLDGLPRRKEVVIFNCHRIPLPPVIYP